MEALRQVDGWPCDHVAVAVAGAAEGQHGDIDEVGRAHAEAFTTARPATTGIVTALLDPRWRVEIEAEAVIVGR